MDCGLPVDHFDMSPDAVRDRFEWAMRQGNPQWLWPYTTIAGWRAALSEIEEATRAILTGDGPANLQGDPRDIGVAAFTSGMGPLLGYWIGEGRLHASSAVGAILRLHHWHNCRRMEELSRRAIATVEALADAGLKVTVLKGMYTAHVYFPEPGTRPLSDIDLLIEARQEGIAAEVLGSLGFLPETPSFGEQSWRMSNTPIRPPSLSLTHRHGPWCIDLHTSLNIRYAPGASMIELDRAVRERAHIPWPLSPKGTVLPPNELILHLACHASVPFVSLTMLRLAELILVIRRLESEQALHWERFLHLAQQTGSASNAYPALYFANDMAPGTIPAAILRTMEQQAPAAVRRVVQRLTPATCQRMTGCSIEERFMWTRTIGGWAREIVRDLVPLTDPRELLEIYKFRFWRIARGTVTR